MEIANKIKEHFENQKFSRITRKVAADWNEISRGYIVDFSKNFIVLQDTEDFKACGFNILPVQQITKIRYNNHDRYYDKIMGWENEKLNIKLKTKIDLISWKTIFKTFQQRKMNVIVECENPDFSSFIIGKVKRITDKSVSILYFDAAGFFDEKPTKVEFENISKITFDDRYIDVFSKYTRERKMKKTT